MPLEDSSAIASEKIGVELLADPSDPCSWRLKVLSIDGPGLFFKICEVLLGHSVDISDAALSVKGGLVENVFELKVSRPSDVSDAVEWCTELEDFLRKNMATGGAALQSVISEGSLAAASRRLHVNPDLLSVVSFREIAREEQPELAIHYNLEIEGINQAGLLTYTALVLCRCGFSVVAATISTVHGRVSDSFDLVARSETAEHKLHSYLDVPPIRSRGTTVPLPFHATRSDMVDLRSLMSAWAGRSQVVLPAGDGTTTNASVSQALIPSPNPACGTQILGRSPSTSRSGSFHSDEDDLPSRSRLHSAESGLGDSENPNAVLAISLQGQVSKESSGSGMNQPLDKAATDKQASRTQPGKKHQTPSHPEKRWTSVTFGNADRFEGSCAIIGGTEKRHGPGTYIYSPRSHESYKQYSGQWHEDRKHGHGVLFFRSCGAYVGQWVNNQKSGLGVLLDNPGLRDATAMPSLRYEGQWVEDQPHGLGVEETEASVYFGSFEKGEKKGRGARMNILARVRGAAGVEILRPGRSTPVPLFDALEEEMILLQTEDIKEESNEALQKLVRVEPDHSTTYAEFKPTLQNEEPSLTSGTSSALLIPGEEGFAEDVVDSIVYPRQVLKTDKAGEDWSGSQKAGTRTPTSQESLASHGDAATYISDFEHHSPSATQKPAPSAANPGRLARRANGSGSVEFNLCEENGLLSPSSDVRSPEAARINAGQANRQPSAGATEVIASAIHSAGTSAPAASTSSANTSPSRHRRNQGDGQRKPCENPLLWDALEIAAFMVCLGISRETCQRLSRLTHLDGGITKWLDSSNAWMRRELGLWSPVERLLLRQAMRQLLEIERLSQRSSRSGCGTRSKQASSQKDLLNDTVLGRHVIPLESLALLSKISQGGFGTVYRGSLLQDPRCGTSDAAVTASSTCLAGFSRIHCFSFRRGTGSSTRQVAVKEMKGDQRVGLHELLKEACVMASLEHPNICAFIGVCSDSKSNKNYIISELMDCSLFDVVHQPHKVHWHGELTALVSLSLAEGICAAIIYLHSRSLVHADMKSSNILVDYSSRQLVARLCDFGHAAVRSVPSPHHRCGTPHWAAPEVLRGEALGPAADIYSIGVMLWEMLTQRLPHRGLSFCQVMGAVGWAGWMPDMAMLPDGLPSRIPRVLKRCLAFAPKARPKAHDVSKLLREIPRRERLKAIGALNAFLSS